MALSSAPPGFVYFKGGLRKRRGPLPKFAWPPDKVAELKAMRAMGKSLREIAIHFGAAHRTISRACAAHEISTGDRRVWTPEMIEHVRKRAKEGARTRIIAKELGVKVSQVGDRARNSGIRLNHPNPNPHYGEPILDEYWTKDRKDRQKRACAALLLLLRYHHPEGGHRSTRGLNG